MIQIAKKKDKMIKHDLDSQWVRIDTAVILFILIIFVGLMADSSLLGRIITVFLVGISLILIYKYYIIPNGTVKTLRELKGE